MWWEEVSCSRCNAGIAEVDAVHVSVRHAQEDWQLMHVRMWHVGCACCRCDDMKYVQRAEEERPGIGDWSLGRYLASVFVLKQHVTTCGRAGQAGQATHQNLGRSEVHHLMHKCTLH